MSAFDPERTLAKNQNNHLSGSPACGKAGQHPSWGICFPPIRFNRIAIAPRTPAFPSHQLPVRFCAALLRAREADRSKLSAQAASTSALVKPTSRRWKLDR